MKSMIMTVLAMTACLAVMTPAQAGSIVDEMSLVDARTKISEVIATPAKMTDVMKHLSATNQVKFVAAVNEAISKMPTSQEELNKIFLAVNSAAMVGSQEGNVKSLVAEVFATVPPQYLPTISEGFAETLFSRANTTASYSDAEYIKIAQATMKEVVARTENVDVKDVRCTLAALMFARASGKEEDPDILAALIRTLPDSAQESAKSTWIPEALGRNGARGGYSSMMAEAGVTEVQKGAGEGGESAGEMPGASIKPTGPQFVEGMLSDLAIDNRKIGSDAAPSTITEAANDPTQNSTPGGGGEIGGPGPSNPVVTPDKPGYEPSPYDLQSLGN